MPWYILQLIRYRNYMEKKIKLQIIWKSIKELDQINFLYSLKNLQNHTLKNYYFNQNYSTISKNYLIIKKVFFIKIIKLNDFLNPFFKKSSLLDIFNKEKQSKSNWFLKKLLQHNTQLEKKNKFSLLKKKRKKFHLFNTRKQKLYQNKKILNFSSFLTLKFLEDFFNV